MWLHILLLWGRLHLFHRWLTTHIHRRRLLFHHRLHRGNWFWKWDVFGRLHHHFFQILFGFLYSNLIRHRNSCTTFLSLCVGGIVILHNFDLNSKYSLSQQYVSDSNIQILLARITSRDHVTILELHSFCTGSS